MTKTIFILADSALELIPNQILNSPLIKKYASKKGKKPFELLLDSSFHYKAMTKLKDNERRGRPDIIHFCLLSILGAPLVKNNKSNNRIFIHTYDNKIFEVNPEIRIPKHYNRFVGLMEQLLVNEVIKNGEKVMMQQLINTSLEQIVNEIPRENRILFTSKGKFVNLVEFFTNFSMNDLILIIGGFPHGSFSINIDKIADKRISIAETSLEAWIVTSRVTYIRELTII